MEAAFQAKTSGVIAFSNNSFMYSTAAMVSGELITTCSFSSWIEAPYDHMSARPAMLESISWERPMPIWMPCSAKIFDPPSSSSSHVLGPLGKPAVSHRLLR